MKINNKEFVDNGKFYRRINTLILHLICLTTINSSDMETAKYDKKRKKRKTRRCLDELRKKTQPKTGVCKINKNDDAKVHKHKSNRIKNNCITSNRLTLFKKAIRSETVTRLQISELEGKKSKSNNKDRETITSNLHTNGVSAIEQINNKIVLETQNHDVTEDSSEIEISSPILTNGKLISEVETPKSAILFSPESLNEEITTNMDSPLETSSISSSSSTINTSNLKIKNMFVDIMDKIEIHMQQNFSQYINTGLIKKTEAKFEKLCAEYRIKNRTRNIGFTNISNISSGSSSSQIISQSVLSSPSSSPEVPIIHNPREYLGCSWTQLSESKTSGIHESSPKESSSSSSVSIHIPSPSPVVAAVYNTPEYSYYPHRLN